jgi:PAS domain S-box-containing protein
MEPLSAPASATAGVADAVLAALDVGVVVEDPQGRALSSNASAERILGLTHEQLAGGAALPDGWGTIHEDGWPLAPDARPAQIALRSGRPCTGVTLGIKHPGGVVTWVVANARPLIDDEADEPFAVAVSYANITEGRRAVERRRRSEERFRSLIEYSSDLITIFDERGKQIYESPSVERVLGYVPGEFDGTSRLSQVHPEDAHDVVSALMDIQGRPGASRSFEYRIQHRDGRWLIVESIATNRLHDPAVQGIVVSTRDLTERRGEQAALRATSSRLTNLVQNLESGVLVEDEERRIVLVNSDFCSIFSIDAPPNVLVGADCALAARRASHMLADPDEFTARIEELTAAGHPVVGEEIAFADGRTFERDYIPIPEERGHLWLYRDISERKRSEQEAARARDEAIRASRLKSEFLATMSHEIRTPMNGVIGTVELLLDTRLSSDQRELAAVVRDSAYGLMSIIDDVLDLSKIEAEKLEPKEVEFQLASVVEGVADVLLSAARSKGLWLTAYVDPRAHAPLRGDAQWLRQVLLNLLGNAVKFTESGEVHIRAELQSRSARSATVRFSVTDSGPGIPVAARDRLFEPFAQLDSTTRRRHGGTGLGLAICQRLVRLMGGDVEVESEEGCGSTFSFTLSFRSGEAAPAPMPTRELRVLLAEACDAASRVVGEYMDAWGMTYEHAGSGEEAAELLRGAAAGPHPFDVAIVGTSLDGCPVTLAETLRAAPGGERLGCVLLKDMAHDAAPDGRTPAPFAAELNKPVKQARLFEAIAIVADPLALPVRQAEEPPPALARPPLGVRVLVADDNAINRELMVRQLTKLGARADAVETGGEAIEAIEAEPYDAVLMDCRMPEVDGLQAARAIRSLGHSLAIVAVTASATAEEIGACRAAGMDVCLPKPFSTGQLGEALARALPSDGVLVDGSALDRLRADVGDDAAVARIAGIYVAGLPTAREELGSALAAGDEDALRQAAHKLRSSSATFGAVRLAELSAELESGADGRAAHLVAEIDGESRRVEASLGAELARQSSR